MKGSLVFSHLERVYVVILLVAGSKTPDINRSCECKRLKQLSYLLLGPSLLYRFFHSQCPTQMGSANPNCEKLEAPLFSISGTPTITSEKLNGTNYLAWSASVEFWFLQQGHYDHLEKSLDEISQEKHDLWKKLDYQLCALLWQSIEPDILPDFKAFKTCHSFWKKAQSVFAYDNKQLYDSAQKLVTLKQSDNDIVSYVSKAQSVVEELKIFLKSDTLEELNKKLDNLFMLLVLHGMQSDYAHVRDQILTNRDLPSMENLVIRLLQVPSPKAGVNSTDSNKSHAISRGNCGGQGGGGGYPQYSSRKRMSITEDANYSLHGFAEKSVRLKKEQEEKEHKKKEKAEAHLYTIIKVARDDDLKDQIGKEIYFDLVDHEKVRSFCVQKQMSFNDFKEDVAKEFDVPVQFQRFWLWAERQDHTYRPNRPLTPMEEAQSVGQLREVSNKVHIAELKLFLEVELGPDLRPIAPPAKTKGDILLFFKLYDPEKELLRYVGRLFVKSTGKPSEILTTLNKMAGYDPDEDIVLYEEIKFEPNVMCEPIDKTVTFRASQLEDGDIVCFQKVPAIDTEESLRYPDVPSYLEYVHNRQVFHFRSLEKPKEDDFSLEMSRLYTYDDVVERVAQQLGVDDPSMIRLTPHNCYSQQPKPQSIKYRGVEHLSDMLVHYNQTSDILYYEVLDIPLPELQGLKTLKVAFHPATKDEVVIHTIRLPKQSTVGDVLDDLKTKVELSGPQAELRLLEVFYHKIYKVFPPHEKIENINDQYWTLRAEEIPEEEKNLSPHDRLIHVYHFNKDTAQNQMKIQNFGEPFFLVIHEGEALAEIKVRIQKKLRVPGDEFVKWKFAFFSLGRPEYLQGSDIVSSCFQRRDVYGAWEQYLGLDHTDTAPKRSYAVNQNRHTFEKPVKIYN